MSIEAHYFIAIPLPESVQRFFSVWQDNLKNKLPYQEWTHRTDLHITLKFLGSVDVNKREQLVYALEPLRKISTFTIDVGSLGSFGNAKKPRVLWAGVKKTAELAALQERVEEFLVGIGFQLNTRAYRPHITLAKKWHGESAGDILEAIKKQYTAERQVFVENIVLYRIHPRSTPKYQPVRIYRLQGGE